MPASRGLGSAGENEFPLGGPIRVATPGQSRESLPASEVPCAQGTPPNWSSGDRQPDSAPATAEPKTATADAGPEAGAAADDTPEWYEELLEGSDQIELNEWLIGVYKKTITKDPRANVCEHVGDLKWMGSFV
eukprot:729271-Alexandrium_andersonii.AAC.1